MNMVRPKPVFDGLSAAAKIAMRQGYLTSKLQKTSGSTTLTFENTPAEKVAQYFKETIMANWNPGILNGQDNKDTVGLIGNLESLGETKIVDEMFLSIPVLQRANLEFYPPKRDIPYPRDMLEWNEWIELNLSNYTGFDDSQSGEENLWFAADSQRMHGALETVLSKGVTYAELEEFDKKQSEKDIPAAEWPEWYKEFAQTMASPDEEWYKERAMQAYKEGELTPNSLRGFANALIRQILCVEKEKLRPNSKVAILMSAGRRHPKTRFQDEVHQDLMSCYGDAITWVEDLQDDGWGQPEGRNWLAFQVDEGKLP